MTSATFESIYAANYDRLAALGYSTFPLKAHQKVPAIGKWQAGCDRMPTQAEHDSRSQIPDAGIGICLGLRVGEYQIIAIDIDVDDDDLDKLSAALPISPMEKVGRKGLTRYYLADPSIKTTRYRASDGRGLADLQARGTYTVIPPSIHPNTGRPYIWTAGDGSTAISDLPILTFDDLDRFEDALEGLGCRIGVRTPAVLPEAAQKPLEELGGDDADNCGTLAYYREINERALAHPGCYVPLLGLHNCRPKAGGYVAVADWRPSRNGNRIEERKRNLSIHTTGIVDFGTEVGYSPIDLVMAARGDDLETAANFLFERTGLKADQDAWFETVSPALERLRLRSSEEDRQIAQAEARVLLAPESEFEWDDREASAARRMEWLVKGLFPRVGVSLLWGQSGSGKSFVALDLAASVATGQDFFGHRVKAEGGTLLALGEGAGTMPDRMNALRIGRFGGVAPSHPDGSEAVDIDRFPVMWRSVGDLANNAKFAAFANSMRRAACQMRERKGVPLRMVIIDTVVASFGFAEDPDANTVTRAMKSLDALAIELDVLIVAIHHAGKSKQAGEHGSYAWRGSAETSIQVDAERDDVTGAVRKRRLFVRKNRHGGNEGWNQSFNLNSIQLDIDDDDDAITSCVVEPIGGVVNPHAATAAERMMTTATRRFMRAFEPVRQGTAMPLLLDNGNTVEAVKVRDVKAEYVNQNDGERASMLKRCERDLKAAIEDGLVAESGGRDDRIVWLVASEIAETLETDEGA